MVEAFDMAALARRRLAINATARATLAGAFDPKPQPAPLPKVSQSHPLGTETIRLPCVSNFDASPSDSLIVSPPKRETVRLVETPPQAAIVSPILRQSHGYETDETNPHDEPGCNQDPPLPTPGTPERAAHDRRHERMCAGLLAQWRRHHGR
jgi:hypothetical protein